VSRRQLTYLNSHNIFGDDSNAPKPPMIMTTATSSTTVPKLPTATSPDPPGLILEIEAVDTYTYIFDTVWQLILDSDTKDPQHPTFGKTEQDYLRAPLFTEKTGVGRTSWHARVKRQIPCVLRPGLNGTNDDQRVLLDEPNSPYQNRNAIQHEYEASNFDKLEVCSLVMLLGKPYIKELGYPYGTKMRLGHRS